MEKQNESKKYVNCEVEKGEIKERAVFFIKHEILFKTNFDSFRFNEVKIHLRFP